MQMQELDAAAQEKVVDLFDNESIWDADDTDGYILQVFKELEDLGTNIITLKDQGWNSLLHMTALWNRAKIMEELVRRGAAVNDKNKNGHTPLDLAMHWGHFDISQQLKHYGAKHTCEKERDIAISQRDLTQQQLKNCEGELDHALATLKRAKQEREQLRIEKDRLVELRAQVVEECAELSQQVEKFRLAAASMAKERDVLQIQTAQLQNELVCEQEARNNAVHSWKVAEKIILELQQVQEECREREEEALRLRNEAIQDRDVARELAHEAQLDQGIAKQNQLDVERERNDAIERLLEGEAEIAHDKEKWRKQIAKTELERRNIQIEIDRQTEILRSENAKLEKTAATLTVLTTRQRAEIERNQLSLLALEKQIDHLQQGCVAAKENEGKLNKQIEALLEERQLEYVAYKARIEAKMQQQCSEELRAMLEAAISTWKSLQSCQQQIAEIDVPPIEPSPGSPSHTNVVMSTIFQRPQTTSATPTSSSQPRLLPFIQDAPAPGLKSSSSTPALPAWTLDSLSTRFADHDQEISNHRALAEVALKTPAVSSTSTQIIELCSFLRSFVTALAGYLIASLKHLRKQAQVHEKMIERKGELIQRFTHHRQEHAKRQNPARFRECSVRPLL